MILFKMKYAQFLIESKKYANTKELDIEEFKKIYNELDCKIPFYRGMKNAPNTIMLVDGSKRERKSLEIGNYYTMAFDKINTDYPKRSNAVFFSGSDNVGYFGATYYAFPLNGVKVAGLNNKDMWGTYIRMSKNKTTRIDMKEFVDMLGELKVSDESMEAMTSDIKKIVKDYVDSHQQETTDFNPKAYTTSDLAELIHDDKDYKKALAIIYAYDPDSVDSYTKDIFEADSLWATLYKSAKDAPKFRHGFEYWTDGEVLLINKHTFDKIDDIEKYDPDV